MSLSAAASLFLLFLFCEVEQTYSSWGVTYGSQYICALKGSTVRMSCMYRHPSQEGNIKISVTQTFWFAKTDEGPVDVKTQEEYADRLEYSSSKKNCTLTIRDVKESDSAVYKFRFITSRSGGSYTGEPGVVLIVTDSDPNLTVRKKSSSWNSNLICSSSCVLPDHSTYVWYKNGKDMEIGTYVYNTWVDSDDTLSCALKGREDFPSPLFCVNNKRCNKVTYSHARICALKGSSVSFYSSFNSYYSSDFVILFWFSPGRSKEPEDLRQDPRYLGRVHVINTIPQSTLTIKNLTENDSAEYRFIFKTNRVTWGSDLHGTTLTVTDLQVEVTRTSTNQDPQYAELKCHSRCTPTGYYYYKWFRNGQDIGHSKSTYKVLINTTDRISCSVLSFKEHKAPEVYAPVLTSVSADPSDGIVEGNRVFLKCSSDANPPANYTWYKKTKMSAHPLHRKDSEFYLNPIQASDSGEYFCVAKNQLGESRSGNLNIDVKYAPKRADVSLSHAEIVEGDSVNLTCSSDGNPAPFNRWYKDNQMMLQGQGGVYQFTFVKSEDSGTYCCEVGNIYGWINSSTVLINVEYSPRLPSVSVNPPGDVAAGSSVNLTCSSAANPAAMYAWYKEDSTSPAADGQTFTIVDIRGEHGGNYYCQARNSRGHHNSTLHLIVVSSSVSSAVVGSIMFLLLIGLFLSAFIIFRKKKAVRQIHQTREGPGDNEAKRLGNLGRHLESSSTAGLGNSADQDDVCYASVHFCKNQEEPLYSNFVPAEPKTSKNQEEDVEYSAVMIKNTPCRKSYDASDESSALYSTVCKVNRL
ncbi:carcinoembryonic antigen-related cell adhesion molecule 1-like [Poecilia latipinna]|uniref:carcinoembryonic antigen-related cell adhesion molecule 1-like n=1 Tax=Poecilia latipinna TaxID=48699 RepID=UPI00072EDB35|nr:PREDICTED: carcinoembryonic antigen-related cell adhesion molecule 1-like [Poecilia latipinna]